MDDVKIDSYLATHPEATPRLNAALAKAQGAMLNAKKDVNNPFFGTKYADLAGIIDAIRAPFAANGLAIVQLVHNDDKGVTVVTRLLHESGEQLESSCWVPVVKKDPQGYGSAMTYSRRFGLQALAGVAAEVDDDGNSHVDPNAKTAKDYTKPKAEKPPSSKPAATHPTAEQMSRLVSSFSGLGVTVAMLEERVGHALGFVTLEEYEALREYGKKKKELASVSADELAAKLEAERAEKGIADEAAKAAFVKAQNQQTADTATARAAIDARMKELEAKEQAVAGPTVSKEVARNKAFSELAAEIKITTNPEAVTLLVASASSEKLFGPGEIKAIQRCGDDRRLVLADKKRKLQIQDVGADGIR